MRLRTVLSLIILAVFGAGLAACGGGSVSSGGGSGSGGTGASSSIIVQSPRTASAFEFQGDPRQARSLAAVFSDFLIDAALAQAFETVILINTENDEQIEGTTNEAGEVTFAVGAGTYIVCFGDPSVPENCGDPIEVRDDQLVFVTLELVDDEVVVSVVEVQDAEDDIVEDPNSPGNADKVLVCHKGMFTISVARPAAVNGHMAHGDTHGSCEGSNGGDIESTSESNGRGGPPEHAGRPDHAGPPNGGDDA